MTENVSPRAGAKIKTKPPWEATITAAPEVLRAIVEEQFPEIAPFRTWALLGSGWDNDVWLADDTWVFRFPRRRLAIPFLRRERVLLPVFSPRLPLPITTPCFLGQEREGFPHIFNGYPHLSGECACRMNPSEAKREEHGVILADFLHALHAIEEDRALASRAREASSVDEGSLERRITWTRGEIARLRDIGLMSGDGEPEEEHIDTLCADMEPVREDEKRWIHGDLYTRHMLLDQNHDLCGVIDWGNACWGDPAYDLGLVFAYLPKTSYDAFAKRHGMEVGEALWRRSLLVSLRHGLALLAYGTDIDDGDLIREAARIRARFVLEMKRLK